MGVVDTTASASCALSVFDINGVGITSFVNIFFVGLANGNRKLVLQLGFAECNDLCRFCFKIT